MLIPVSFNFFLFLNTLFLMLYLVNGGEGRGGGRDLSPSLPVGKTLTFAVNISSTVTQTELSG